MKRKSIFRALVITMLVSVFFTSMVVAAPLSDSTPCERAIAQAEQQIMTINNIITNLTEVGVPQDVLDMFQARLAEEHQYWSQEIAEACA